MPKSEENQQKASAAQKLISQLYITKSGYISAHVVQEFCNVTLKKASQPLTVDEVNDIVDELLLPLSWRSIL